MSYKIKSRIWIETNGEILLGEGRVALLKAIHETGSLSKAAKSLNMSYKKAWSLIDAVNKRAEQPVTSPRIGGKGGGVSNPFCLIYTHCCNIKINFSKLMFRN